MKTEFIGKYYDGMSSKPYLCKILVGGHSVIVITLLDEQNISIKSINWDIEQISKDDAEINGKIRLKYGAFPHQTIEVDNKEFPPSLKYHYPYSAFAKRDFVSIISKKWSLIAVVFLLLIGFGIFAFKVIIPNIGEYAATQVPIAIEESIGEAAYSQFALDGTEDTVSSRLLQEFFKEMNLECNYEYKITVLNSETINAFALPGGRIVVYSGILNEIDKPEELAALLAHESSHIELQHSLKSIFRSLSGYFVISLLFGDTGGITAVVFQNLYVFQDLQYSREMEKEADVQGLECLQKAKINPKGMIELFSSISDDSEDDSLGFSEFISTHPLTKHRIEYIREMIEKDSRKYTSNPKLESLFKELKMTLDN